MKVLVFAVLLVLGFAAAMALPAKENLQTAEQFYYGAPVAYSGLGYSALGYGGYYGYYGR